MINTFNDNVITIIDFNSLYSVNHLIALYLILGSIVIIYNLKLSFTSNDDLSLIIGVISICVIYSLLIAFWPLVSIVMIVRELIIMYKKES